jgi:hypothetical protein
LKRGGVLLAISEYCGEEAVRELGVSREHWPRKPAKST